MTQRHESADERRDSESAAGPAQPDGTNEMIAAPLDHTAGPDALPLPLDPLRHIAGSPTTGHEGLRSDDTLGALPGELPPEAQGEGAPTARRDPKT